MNNTKTKTDEKKGKAVRKYIAAAMVLILGVALFLNWFLNSQSVSASLKKQLTTAEESLGQAQYVSATTAKNDYFNESKLKREKLRDSTMKELNAVIDNEKATSDEKKAAVETYSKLTERASLENDIETLILAKGISECIVVLGDKSCEVIVPEKQLNETLALQIKEIVANKANIKGENISVSSLK